VAKWGQRYDQPGCRLQYYGKHRCAGDWNFSAPAAISASENHMSKRGRKKKSRKKNGANHGNRPNS
jgi:hypothetical protein